MLKQLSARRNKKRKIIKKVWDNLVQKIRTKHKIPALKLKHNSKVKGKFTYINSNSEE